MQGTIKGSISKGPQTERFQEHATHPCIRELRDVQYPWNPDDAEDRYDEKEPPGDNRRVEQEEVCFGDLEAREG